MAATRQIAVEPVLMLVALALLLLLLFETARLAVEHATLAEVRAAQEPSLAEVAKVRTQLEALAGETSRLAAAGNADAQAVLDEMRRQGVTFRPPTGSH